MSHAKLLKEHSILSTRLKNARGEIQTHKRRADQLERELAKEVKAREVARAELERLTRRIPKIMRQYHRDAGMASGDRIKSAQL